MKDFISFIKEQGVVGLASGFILGGAVSTVVASLVNDILNPLLDIVIGKGETFSKFALTIGPAKILVGSFLNSLIDFIVLAFIVFVTFKLLGFDRSNDKKS